MNTIYISNKDITACFKTLGAELTSLRTSNGNEYLWQADPAYWTGQSPLLFPVIGGLPDDSYTLNDKTYQMQKHGFARKADWHIESHGPETITFTLTHSKQTLDLYPFKFKLSVTYTVLNSTLKIEYNVKNNDKQNMPFQIGGHPGFNCPVSSYHLVFNKKENADRLIKKDLLTGETRPCLENESKILLSHNLFDDDAIIFRDLKSTEVSLLPLNEIGLKIKMTFPGFTHFGIWKTPKTNAPFICLEPWFGVDSTEGDSKDFLKKEGIITLSPGENFCSAYTVELS